MDYIRRLADDYKGHTSATGLTNEYMGPRVRSALRYIRRWLVTDEYIVKFISTVEYLDLISSELHSLLLIVKFIGLNR
jgi:hypothetical protein